MNKPAWLKGTAPRSAGYMAMRSLLRQQQLHTVCTAAACPNIGQCWQEGTAAFMILGNVCTRRCAFCAVPTAHPSGALPEPPDPTEPHRLATAVQQLRLRHVVITSVDRDDLPDGGAGQFAACLHTIRSFPVTVEVLTPDFRNKKEALEMVLQAAPTVFNHNLETVSRLYPTIRPAANYEYSLEVLRRAATYPGRVQTKSGIMLGLGEKPTEVQETLRDLRAVGVELLTIGQYLQPSRTHHPVIRFVTPEEFAEWQQEAAALGFRRVASHPLARSSFQAEQFVHADADVNNHGGSGESISPGGGLNPLKF